MIRLCGAKTRAGTPCRRIAMKNGRCMNHGGKSTGARTKAGLAKIGKARTKSGFWSKQAKLDRAAMRHFGMNSKTLLGHIKAWMDKQNEEELAEINE